MGIVYEGEIVDFDLLAKYQFTKIAVKCCKVGSENINDLYFEIAVMNSVRDHPNVVQLVGYSDEPFTIITKLYKGSLTDLIYNSKTTLEETQIVPLALDICEGMNSKI